MPQRDNKTLDVLSIGVCVVDALGRPVDQYPEKGKLATFDEMQLSIGGPAAASAVAIAKMGGSVSLVGRIGADGLGDFFLNYVSDSGVDASRLARDSAISTAFTFVAISSDGERTFFHCPGADRAFSIDDVDMEMVTKAKIVHIGGSFVMDTFDGAQSVKVLHAAKEAGALTSVDTAYNSAKDPESVLGEAFCLIDYIFMGYDEGVHITGKRDHREIASHVLDRGCKVAVVKLGERGSYVLSEDGGFEIGAFPATVIDTCGAGDVYVGGFLFGLLQGWPHKKCGSLGALLASYSVSAIGGTTGVPKIEDLGYLESLI